MENPHRFVFLLLFHLSIAGAGSNFWIQMNLMVPSLCHANMLVWAHMLVSLCGKRSIALVVVVVIIIITTIITIIIIIITIVIILMLHDIVDM